MGNERESKRFAFCVHIPLIANWLIGCLGAEYNDVFSWKCINSKGKRAFYCCQLVGQLNIDVHLLLVFVCIRARV